jgi:hypothetical protein
VGGVGRWVGRCMEKRRGKLLCGRLCFLQLHEWVAMQHRVIPSALRNVV